MYMQNVITSSVGLISTSVPSEPESLQTESQLSISGFGVFLVSQRPEQTGRNPQTGEMIQIAASKTVKFKPGKILKEAVK